MGQNYYPNKIKLLIVNFYLQHLYKLQLEVYSRPYLEEVALDPSQDWKRLLDLPPRSGPQKKKHILLVNWHNEFIQSKNNALVL